MAIKVVIFGWAESVHLSRWVRGMHTRGFDIKLISLGGDPKPEIPTVVIPRLGPLPYIRYAGRAGREARAFKPDLVHAHYAAGFGLWGMMSRITPLLVSVWGSEVLTLAKRPWYRALIRRILTKADKVTVTGSYLLDASIKVCPDIRDKTTIIPFGVDLPEQVAPAPPDSPFRMCYLKLHHAYYGPDTLIKAIDLVRESRPDIRLTMAGEGDLTEQLKTMVRDRELGDIVTFPGFVDNSTVYDVIGQHHLMVMPSLKEGFGVAALEAGACGRPVIASRVGGIPEVLRDGVTGLLVPPGDERALADAILRLANDSELRSRMGEEARERVRSVFDWERSLDAMSELYERMVRENRKS